MRNLMTAALLSVTFFPAVPAAAADAPRTPEELEDHAYVVAKLRPLVDHRHDLSDDRELRFLLRRLALAGITEEALPATYRAHLETRELHRNGGFEPAPTFDFGDGSGTITPAPFPVVNLPVSLGLDDGGSYQSSGLSYAQNGTVFTSLILSLHRSDNHQQISQPATLLQYGTSRYLQIDANPGPDPGVPVYALLTYSLQTFGTGSAAAAGGTRSGSLMLRASQLMAAITNTDPAKQAGRGTQNPDDIVVCMWRNIDNQEDCDYWNNDNGGTGNDLTIAFPINGSVAFTDESGPVEINAPSGQCDPKHPQLPITVVTIVPANNDSDTGCYLMGPTTCSFWHNGSDSYGTVSGNTASWSVPHGAFTGQRTCLATGQTALYTMINQFSLADNMVAAVTISSSAPPDHSGDGPFYQQIDPLQVFYGCLAEGTGILLADGSTRAVEGVVVQRDRVRADGSGRALQVVGNSKGREPIPMLHLTDEAGHELLLTEGHPVVTTSGVKLAKELSFADRLVTVDGPSALVGMERRKFDGAVWSLDLGSDEGELRPEERTLFANGILVGDLTAQAHYEEAFKTRKPHILERLPEEFHGDYFAHAARQEGGAR